MIARTPRRGSLPTRSQRMPAPPGPERGRVRARGRTGPRVVAACAIAGAFAPFRRCPLDGWFRGPGVEVPWNQPSRLVGWFRGPGVEVPWNQPSRLMVASGDEELEQRLLGVQAVLGLVPDRRALAGEDAPRDLLARNPG